MTTDRQRGGATFVEKWTNARAARIGVLTAQGYSSRAIAEELGADVSPETIRRMWRLWGIDMGANMSGDVSILVPLSVRERSNIYLRAQQNGLSLTDFCRQFLNAGTMPRDMFRQILSEARK